MIVAATGHRDVSVNYEAAKRGLNSFLKLSRSNIVYAISGMAAGWDTTFARACLYYEIPLHLYIPFRGQKPTSEHYEEICEKAASLIYCADYYHKRCFLDRDDEMVKAANLFLAFLSPSVHKGGTFYTVNKAKRAGLPIINFWI